jgi:hypothetical protein
MKLSLSLSAACMAVLIAAPGWAQDKEKAKPYPLGTCVVSDEPLGEEPHVFVHEGREVKLCCTSCLRTFNREQKKFTAKIDAAAKKVKPYPLKNCVVSDEPFGGEMGEPYVFIHEGREIKLCCKSCLRGFKRDPAKHIKKLEQAGRKTGRR